MSFAVKKVASGWKFDLLAANGQVIAVSEVYRTESACHSGVQSVGCNAPTAPIEDQTAPTQRYPNPKFEVFADKAGRFRFRLKAKNGRIIAVSQGYSTKAACLDGIESVRKNAAE